jgi:predicted AAA+ superfamily ATPase
VVSADAVDVSNSFWLEQQWETSRIKLKQSGAKEFLLVVDEIQKINNWSETVKMLWDTDTKNNVSLKVVVLGSSRLLIQQGLTESLAGRFETTFMSHWSYSEMHEAFDWNENQYVWFGGYPGAATLISDEQRWKNYVKDSLIETSISKDILMLTRVDKPALMKRLFELSCHYSGQILSFNKMLGQLKDAGNTTTLSHYLSLLSTAGLVAGIEKYSNNVTFRLNPRICEALLDFSKGFKKYELKTALSFNSIYSMRLYELLSGQKKPISYLIQNLKIMFKVEDKYKLTADFIRKTIDVAQKELDEKSPYSFIYKPNKNGKKIDSITFYPVYKPENRDPELDKKELQKKASISWDLEKMSVDYLIQNFGFTEKEIKNNIDLLKMAQKELDLVYELSKLKVKAETAKSPQAFVIGCIKKLLKA